MSRQGRRSVSPIVTVHTRRVLRSSNAVLRTTGMVRSRELSVSLHHYIDEDEGSQHKRDYIARS